MRPMKTIAVISPHPDDESLGCGGTLLKHRTAGDEVHWINITGISVEAGYCPERVASCAREMQCVSELYGMAALHNLALPTTKLDDIPLGEIIEKIRSVFEEVRPEVVYLPFRGDIHSDHKVVFDAVSACTKWFRHKSIKRILAYEVLSETDFQLTSDTAFFSPNVFVDISDFLEKKIEILSVYASEMGSAPFPRSDEALRALAVLRGAASGYRAAEAFVLLKEMLD